MWLRQSDGNAQGPLASQCLALCCCTCSPTVCLLFKVGMQLSEWAVSTECSAHSRSLNIVRLLRCRLSNVFIIGKDDNPPISLPKGHGVRLDILQEQAKREAQRA